MSHGKYAAGGKYYLLFILFLVFFGTAAPVSYVLVFSYFDSYLFTIDLVSPESFVQGNWYTLSATLLLLHAAYLLRPTTANRMEIKWHESEYVRFRYLLFFLAVVAIGTNILLDLLYGRSQLNLTPQRPPLAVYLGYFSAGLSFSGIVIVMFTLLLYKKIDRLAFIVILLMLIQSISSWSRSGIINIVFYILLGLAYSSPTFSQISFSKVAFILLAGVIAVALGDIARGAEPFQIFFNVLSRFYENNQTLYLAVENPSKVYEILMEGQPSVLLQQMFSFAIERTEYPSSVRLLEYWGGSVSPDERGHMAGYAYGWLGLTFGMFGWSGLIFIYAFFLLAFLLLRAMSRRITLVNIVFFIYVSSILLEFFGNLGLDSFVEKLFKGFLYSVSYILFIATIALLAGRSAGRSHHFGARLKEVTP